MKKNYIHYSFIVIKISTCMYLDYRDVFCTIMLILSFHNINYISHADIFRFQHKGLFAVCIECSVRKTSV